MSEEEAVKQGMSEEDLLKKSIYTWTFLDSARLFPSSLNDLCKMYEVEGKATEYKQEWNDISLLDNKEELEIFTQYSKQDSISLLLALLKARKIYLTDFDVDITKVVSAPSLSLLIFRHKYLELSIPILQRDIDSIIRQSYFGGSSDYNIHYGENLKYYDVNSLYPFAMMNDMPLHYLFTIENSGIELEDTFGFVEAIITPPKDIQNPLLMHHYMGKNIHPIGTWQGTYFSEELKAAVKYGYEIEILKVHQFSRIQDLFKEYVSDFYELKKKATAEKNTTTTTKIAKLHLNSLYGIFGRSLNVLSTKVPESPAKEIDIVSKYPVKSIINVNEHTNIFLTYSNVDFNLIKETNSELNINLLLQPMQIVKSNVALASAITAYARIEMMKYKTIPGLKVLYTDTDSIFTNMELPSYMVGDDLGQMKDELKGGWIKEAYFFGVKKYAYTDDKNNVKTIFSGLVRNSLTWEEVVRMSKGETILKEIPAQFMKNLSKLEISILHKWVEIKFKSDKILKDNQFLPIEINDINVNVFTRISKIFVGKIYKFLGRYKKKQ